MLPAGDKCSSRGNSELCYAYANHDYTYASHVAFGRVIYKLDANELSLSQIVQLSAAPLINTADTSVSSGAPVKKFRYTQIAHFSRSRHRTGIQGGVLKSAHRGEPRYVHLIIHFDPDPHHLRQTSVRTAWTRRASWCRVRVTNGRRKCLPALWLPVPSDVVPTFAVCRGVAWERDVKEESIILFLPRRRSAAWLSAS